MVWLAGALACGLLLNGALVSLAERRGEVAVLRVQGFTRGEVADLFLYEQVLAGLLGIGTGVPFGWLLISWVHSNVETEILRLPFVVSQTNIWTAISYSTLFLVLAHLVLRVLVARDGWQANLAVKE
jgi:putative ABC transport system permease protein